MKIKSIVGIMICFMLLSVTFMAGTTVMAEEIIVPDYEFHDTIIILNESSWTSENGVVSGNGTESDPYIIENWYINATILEGDVAYFGILIVETESYFIIRNCFITNLITESPKNEAYGLYFYDVNNGKIENCYIEECLAGIVLDVCESFNINNNTIYENGDQFTPPVEPPNGGGAMYTGIDLFESYNITIKNNIFDSNYQESIAVNEYCEGILIEENDFINVGIGILVASYVSDCLIYHNNFMSINSSLEYAYDGDECAMWDNGTEGNYWSNYDGIDADGNGIGDTLYDIGDGNQDNYPLMEYYNWHPEHTMMEYITEILMELLPLFIFILVIKFIINMIISSFKPEDSKGFQTIIR